jgi:hypothetical protein
VSSLYQLGRFADRARGTGPTPLALAGGYQTDPEDPRVPPTPQAAGWVPLAGPHGEATWAPRNASVDPLASFPEDYGPAGSTRADAPPDPGAGMEPARPGGRAARLRPGERSVVGVTVGRPALAAYADAGDEQTTDLDRYNRAAFPDPAGVTVGRPELAEYRDAGGEQTTDLDRYNAARYPAPMTLEVGKPIFGATGADLYRMARAPDLAARAVDPRRLAERARAGDARWGDAAFLHDVSTRLLAKGSRADAPGLVPLPAGLRAAAGPAAADLRGVDPASLAPDERELLMRLKQAEQRSAAGGAAGPAP